MYNVGILLPFPISYSLKNNSIGKKGAKAIAGALNTNTGLLELRYNAEKLVRSHEVLL